MKRWHWQYLIPIILLVLNVDLVVIPFLKNLGFSAVKVFFMAAPLASIELFIQYWFWKWFRFAVIVEFVVEKIATSEHIQDGIDLGKKIKSELKESGYLDKLASYLLKTFNYATDENNPILRKIKRGGHWAMFLLGIEPWPGWRLPGVIFCGVTNWKAGLYTLAVGNVLHLAYVIGIWSLVFN